MPTPLRSQAGSLLAHVFAVLQRGAWRASSRGYMSHSFVVVTIVMALVGGTA